MSGIQIPYKSCDQALVPRKEPPPDLKGKTPFTPYSGFTPGTPVFTHYAPARQGYSPSGKGITES